MTDVVTSVEARRHRDGVSQSAVAASIGVTQGHYSKIASGKVPVSPNAARAMEAWLSDRSEPVVGGDASKRMRQLAGAIRRQCIELMHLTEQVVGDLKGG